MISGDFPDNTVEDASNYCRNPIIGFKAGPWCYTVDRNVRWESCDVPVCGKEQLVSRNVAKESHYIILKPIFFNGTHV